MNVRMPPKTDAGFTLLEVIVAFALLATTVTVILQLFSSNLRVLSTSEDFVWATARAEAAMRETLDKENLAVGTSSETTSDGYTVETTISKVLETRTRELPLEMLEVGVKLSWSGVRGERSMVLKTMKMVKREVVGRI